MNMTYRLVEEPDINMVKSIYDANIDKLHGAFRSIDEWKNILKANNQHYVVIDDNEIIAWFRIDFEDNQMFLGMIQVSPIHQRKGVGTFILNEFEKIAISKQYLEVYIHTTKDNDVAISFYNKNGYQIISEEECQTADRMTRLGLTLKKHLC